MRLLVFGAFVATKAQNPSSKTSQRRRRAVSRSPSPAASHINRKSKGHVRASASTTSGDDESASIYLYGHIPDASSFLSAFYRCADAILGYHRIVIRMGRSLRIWPIISYCVSQRYCVRLRCVCTCGSDSPTPIPGSARHYPSLS